MSTFLPNLFNTDIAIMMDDRMLHLAVVVAMVMGMWGRRPMTHCVFSAWLHCRQRGEMCIWPCPCLSGPAVISGAAREEGGMDKAQVPY